MTSCSPSPAELQPQPGAITLVCCVDKHVQPWGREGLHWVLMSLGIKLDQAAEYQETASMKGRCNTATPMLPQASASGYWYFLGAVLSSCLFAC